MIAEPPFDDGTTHVRRTWPERLVGAAVVERGAAGFVRGTALTTVLAGLVAVDVRAETRKK